MKKRSLHDKVILTITAIVYVVMLTCGCFLDSDDWRLFFRIETICFFYMTWFALANRGRKEL